MISRALLWAVYRLVEIEDFVGRLRATLCTIGCVWEAGRVRACIVKASSDQPEEAVPEGSKEKMADLDQLGIDWQASIWDLGKKGNN